MNPEWKTRWLTALRSGEYEQGSGNLQIQDAYWCEDGSFEVAGDGDPRFCCLGVLCDIYDPDGWGKATIAENGYDLVAIKYHDEEGFLPDDIAEEIGLSGKVQSDLAQRNDEGETFAKIANWIEENL